MTDKAAGVPQLWDEEDEHVGYALGYGVRVTEDYIRIPFGSCNADTASRVASRITVEAVAGDVLIRLRPYAKESSA